MIDGKMALEPARITDFAVSASALGSGTTAKVYQAVHKATGRPVAIKVMAEGISGSEMRERFAREALLLAGVESRHVCKILGFGFGKGQPFLVLELLHGETLDAKLRRDGPVPPAIAVRWIEQLIVGVRDCHDANVIHRDIKPSNVFVHHDGFEESVKLIDFGVARLREITGDPVTLTSATHLIGSMGYMAPEQFRNAKSVGFQADLYAVGVVIFRALTGRLPFVSRSLDAILKMKMEQAAPAVSSMMRQHNPILDAFVRRSMMRDPEERFRSARDMLEQWWSVMSSLDDDAATSVMRDPSWLQPARSARASQPPASRHPASQPPASRHPASQPPASRPVGHEDRTIRRGPIPLPSGRASASYRPEPLSTPRPPPIDDALDSGLTAVTAVTGVTVVTPFSDDTDPATSAYASSRDPRRTAREHPGEHLVNEEDPSDQPTRTDASLRELVEHELELHRARKQKR
mgnify:CR=1 FL=1